MNKEVEKVFTERGFTNIEQMATMFDWYKEEIERLNNVINEFETYLEESKGYYEEYTCAIKKLKELKGE